MMKPDDFVLGELYIGNGVHEFLGKLRVDLDKPTERYQWVFRVRAAGGNPYLTAYDEDEATEELTSLFDVIDSWEELGPKSKPEEHRS